MKLFSALLALSLAVGLSAPAHAERGDVQRGGGKRGDLLARILHRFDANHDGMLDRQELQHLRRAAQRHRQGAQQAQGRRGSPGLAPAARRQQRFAQAVARFDRDRDGRLGQDEVPPRLAQRLARFDRNRDGWVDAAEVAQQPPRQPAAQPAPLPGQ